MKNVLLKNIIDSYITDCAAHSNMSLMRAMQESAQDGTTRQLNATYTNMVISGVRALFQGYNAQDDLYVSGLVAKCKDYFMRFPEEISQEAISELIQYLQSYCNASNQSQVEAAGQFCAHQNLPNNACNSFKAQLKTTLDSIANSNLRNMGRELHLALKDVDKHRKIAQAEEQKRNEELKNEKESRLHADKTAREDRRWTRIIAIVSICTPLLTTIIGYLNTLQPIKVDLEGWALYDKRNDTVSPLNTVFVYDSSGFAYDTTSIAKSNGIGKKDSTIAKSKK